MRCEDTVSVAAFAGSFKDQAGAQAGGDGGGGPENQGAQIARNRDVEAAGRAEIERWREERSRQLIAEQKRMAASRRFHSGCPPAMRTGVTDWDAPRLAANREVIARVREWRPEPGLARQGLLLSGPTGRGKSRSLFALWERLALTDGVEVGFWSSREWFSELQRQVDYGRDNAMSFIQRCAAFPVVIIDDLGQEPVIRSRADWAMAWLFGLLDARLERCRPFICSTNLSADELSPVDTPRAGLRADPLIRRLMDLCVVVRFV
jgi:DNA replication protein DnaC